MSNTELKPPNLVLALTEAPRALADAAFLHAAAPLLRRLPRVGLNRSVMIIPGFMGDDRGNGPLIRFLRSRGYTVAGWGQGRNLGVNGFDEDKLREDLNVLVAAGAGKVSLVGHSLGGIYAREIARAEPQIIRQVITLGSPFGRGGKNASHANSLYQRLNPAPDARDVEERLALAPPVPTTAIYTRGDGIVNWRSAVQDGGGAHIQNVEVLGSHIGLNVNAAVWYWIARKLAEH